VRARCESVPRRRRFQCLRQDAGRSSPSEQRRTSRTMQRRRLAVLSTRDWARRESPSSQVTGALATRGTSGERRPSPAAHFDKRAPPHPRCRRAIPSPSLLLPAGQAVEPGAKLAGRRRSFGRRRWRAATGF
jgi:hypothetical protein